MLIGVVGAVDPLSPSATSPYLRNKRKILLRHRTPWRRSRSLFTPFIRGWARSAGDQQRPMDSEQNISSILYVCAYALFPRLRLDIDFAQPTMGKGSHTIMRWAQGCIYQT